MRLVFEAEGDTWMLPEAYKSGTLTLYRARSFPDDWEAVCSIPLDSPAIDATPLWHGGRWWLFYSPSHDALARRSNLHVAWSDRLTGPWHLHPLNPVRADLASARPGGRPMVWGGAIILPGVTIGDDAIIGSGSVVTRDVPRGATALGNPARVRSLRESAAAPKWDDP